MLSSTNLSLKKSKKRVTSKIHNHQTQSDYWKSHPYQYYVRQSLMLASELAFLVSACLFFAFDVK